MVPMKLPDDATTLPPPLFEDEALEEDGESPMTTEKGTDTRDVEGHSKEEALGEDGDKLEVEQNEASEQQPAEEPDGSAEGSAVPSKAPSKLSVRSAATKDAAAAEEGAADDAKGSRLSVRSISIHTRSCLDRMIE